MIVALLCLRGGSCLRVERPYPAPTAAQVLAAVSKRAQRVRSLRAEARMSYRSAQGKIKATVRMMAAAGAKLRFDVVSPFDTPLATLVAAGGQFALIDAQKNRHYYGPASPCNLARLLRVKLKAEDVLPILGGGTPVIPHESISLSWDDRAGVEVLTVKGKKLVQTIRLDGRDRRWRLRSSEVRDERGATLLQIAAADHRSRGGVEVPERLHVAQPKNKATLELQFKRQEINITLPKVAFERPSGGGLPSQRVDCGTTVIVRPPASAPKAR